MFYQFCTLYCALTYCSYFTVESAQGAVPLRQQTGDAASGGWAFGQPGDSCAERKLTAQFA